MRTWAEVNLDNLGHNVRKIRELSGGKEVVGVIKADAYGMGAVEYARELAKNGVKMLGVACYEEACELKDAGVEAEVLVFGCTPYENMGTALERGMHLTISSRSEVEFLEKNKLYPKVHVKVDTGMGRVGYTPEEAMEAIKYMRENKIADVVGVYTHLSVADDTGEDEYTLGQIEKFKAFEELEGIQYRHILNSCGSIRFGNKTETTHVRPGILLHGIVPFESELQDLFKYVFKLKTKVLYMKELRDGEFISYGKSYQGKPGELIATLPVGYADGFDRRFSNGGKVEIEGVECSVVGRVCMDMTMVKIPEELKDIVKVGTEVTLIGDDISTKAEKIGTIPYEVMTGIGKRVTRCYVKNDRTIRVRSLEMEEGSI